MMERKEGSKAVEGEVAESERSTSPIPPQHHPLHQFQQTLGNRALGHFIQRKLRVSQPDDTYEQEADRVADQVVSLPDNKTDGSAALAGHGHVPQIQRACADCEEEEGIHRKAAGPLIQTKPEDSEPANAAEEDDNLSADVAESSETITVIEAEGMEGPSPPIPQDDEASAPNEVQRKAADGIRGSTSPDVQSLLNSRLGHGSTLPTETLGRMESAMGAKFSDVRVHNDDHATDLNRSLHAQAFTYGRDIFFGEAGFDPYADAGQHLLAHELTHVIQQRGSTSPMIHRQEVKPPKSVQASFTVTVHEEISANEFLIRAYMQYQNKGRLEVEQLAREGKISCTGPVCSKGVTADLVGKPITVRINISGMSNSEKQAVARRNDEVSKLPAAERASINSETDRRFWKRTEYKRGKPLGKGPSEEGMRNLWLRAREGVLQDQESIAKLSPKIQEFINPGNKRKIPPQDYEAVLRIAKRLESFSEADWLLYQRRVTDHTDDYELVERSIESFQAQQAAEAKTMDRIKGNEGLYQQVKSFKALERYMYTPRLKSDRLPLNDPGNIERLQAERESVTAALADANFGSIEDFDAAIAAFIELFRKRAVEIALLALRQSEKIVVAEKARYGQKAENDALFAKLAPVRTALDESHQAAAEAMPTPMQLKTESWNLTAGQEAAGARYIASSQRAGEERKKHEDTNPILKDPKLSSYALEAKDADSLGETLRRNADDRLTDISKTRINVLDKKNFIFKLDNVIKMTRQELGVTPNSIYDLALTDYQRDISFADTLIAIAIGALAIGLGLLSFGTGTVAVLAGGAGLTLSVYGASEEWKKYSEAEAAAHTSFDKAMSVSSEEPSLIWVAISLIGVGLDGAALASAFKAVAPAARALSETGGSVAKFETELAKVGELSQAVKNNLSRAARAEEEYQVAVKELGQAMKDALGRAHNLGLDPDVLNKITKAAYYAIKKGITNFEVFLRELRLQKFVKGIDFDSLGPQEIEALEKAFKAGADQVALDAAKTSFSIKVPYKSGPRVLTLDDSGKLLLDGKPLAATKYEEVYKQLGLTHAYKGHGPNKNLADVAQEALTNKPSFASGKFSSDKAFIESFGAAKAKFMAQGGKNLVVEIEVTPNVGRAFLRTDKVPVGVTPILPFDAPAGVVEVLVTHVRAVFAADGSLVSIFPVALP